MIVPRRLSTALKIFAWFTTIGLLLTGYRYFEYVSNHEHVSLFSPLINELFTGAWMAGVLFSFVLWFARRFRIDRSNWKTRLPLHFCALIGFSLAHTSLLWLLRPPLYRLFGLGAYDYGLMAARYPMEFFNDCISYTIGVTLIYLFDLYVRSAQLEARLSQARLENLRLQLQPHFLFNALNAISSAVYEDPRKADAMIARLSDLLRHTISDSSGQTAPLEREIVTLELYLDVMRQRFEDKLRVEIQIAPDVRDALTPHLLLQPLVENCIRHGADPQSNAVDVTVTAARESGSTLLRVRDRGRGLPQGGMRRGTGLSNTAERLAQLYGERHKLEFENCAGGGLQVTVAFPYQT
jgi:two-component system, LytTR family, sensor kinase